MANKVVYVYGPGATVAIPLSSSDATAFVNAIKAVWNGDPNEAVEASVPAPAQKWAVNPANITAVQIYG